MPADARIKTSTSAPTLVLLPGLDGTGALLRDFAVTLGHYFEVAVISYPTDVPLGYEELLVLVRQQLPDVDYIIVAESFSGPLALQLAFEADERLRGVVLAASFARVDIHAKWLLKILIRAVSPRLVPMRFLKWMLLGKSATPAIEQKLRGALRTVSTSVLRKRANAALNVDMTEQGRRIARPVLYLRATQDRLISGAAGADIGRLAQSLTIEDIRAPHFLFQVAPDECAAAIRKFAGDQSVVTRSTLGCPQSKGMKKKHTADTLDNVSLPAQKQLEDYNSKDTVGVHALLERR